MTSQEPIAQAERELAEVKGLVDEQYGIVIRLKRLGADTHEAVRLLIDLLELQQTREQRLAEVRIHHHRHYWELHIITFQVKEKAALNTWPLQVSMVD